MDVIQQFTISIREKNSQQLFQPHCGDIKAGGGVDHHGKTSIKSNMIKFIIGQEFEEKAPVSEKMQKVSLTWEKVW